ncbi:DUF4328 domain-containing protein [Erythrobacter sp. SD-21]|uniref:DUF4328 domain-containing protein n=1 Tax=Erythrobacter sp. SD-21 TaxID=161528 RepID=UPI000153F7AF|nr:DUF4328 domain-containing protein [Erythrobacter sp. SD-21]EDL48572.1 hypothetical protein ED21_30244 [Erythrobacter sp. SD-21]
MESNLGKLNKLSLAVTVFAALVTLVGLGLIGWTTKEDFFPAPVESETIAEAKAAPPAVVPMDRSRPAELASYGSEGPEDGIYYHSEGYDPETDTFVNETQYESEDYTIPDMGGEEFIYYDEETDTYVTATRYPLEEEYAPPPPASFSPFGTMKSWLESWKSPTGIALTALLLLTICFFVFALMWVWRAHENMRVHGFRLSNSPKRAVTNYFIPGLNLVLPFEAMRELYNRSEGEPQELADASVSDVTAWWTAVAVGLMIFVVIAIKAAINVGTPFNFLTPWWMDFLVISFALALQLGSTLLFAGLARRISQFQSDFLPQVEPMELEDDTAPRMRVRIITDQQA